MSKVVDIARTSARSSVNFFIGLTLSTLITSIGTMIVMRLLDPGEYGLVAVALIAPTILSLFGDWGMSFALTRDITRYRVQDDGGRIKVAMRVALLFEAAAGSLLAVASLVSAGFVAVYLFYRPQVAPLIQIASILVLGNALRISAEAVFLGFERLEYTSFVRVTRSVIWAVTGPVLVILGLGALGVVIGTVVAYLIAGVVGVTLATLAFYRRMGGGGGNPTPGETFQRMFRYGLPLTLATLLGGYNPWTGLFPELHKLVLAWFVTDTEIGNFIVAVKFMILISLLTFPMSASLFPVFSKIDPVKENRELATLFKLSVKYSSLLVVPAAAASMALSKPLVYAIFGSKYASAPLYVTLYAAVFFLTSVGFLSVPSALIGLGETKTRMLLSVVTIAVFGVLGPTLTLEYGVTGLIVGIFAAFTVGQTYGLRWMYKHYGISVDWMPSARICLASMGAASMAYLSTFQVVFRPQLALVFVGGLIFIVFYLILLPLVKAVDSDDINNLRKILGELGPFSGLIIPLINLEEKILGKIPWK
ncbi:MAG: oligosaccharide flippase family protein [Candidatus Geothermarchaeales archaeon]